jgi:septal ring factor EnvC (AmiA/AmiB activator)
MTNTAIEKKISKLETQIEQKKLIIETAKADIKEVNKEIANLRKEQKEQGFTDLRKIIELHGMSPTEVIDLIKS